LEVVDAVNITFYGVVFVTLFWLLPFWLLAVRPRYRRERTGSRGSARPT